MSPERKRVYSGSPYENQYGFCRAVFIVDAADADEVGRAHRLVFDESTPAATMVVVAGLHDPAWRVKPEIEAVL